MAEYQIDGKGLEMIRITWTADSREEMMKI